MLNWRYGMLLSWSPLPTYSQRVWADVTTVENSRGCRSASFCSHRNGSPATGGRVLYSHVAAIKARQVAGLSCEAELALQIIMPNYRYFREVIHLFIYKVTTGLILTLDKHHVAVLSGLLKTRKFWREKLKKEISWETWTKYLRGTVSLYKLAHVRLNE